MENNTNDFDKKITRINVGGMYSKELEKEMNAELSPQNKEEMAEILLLHLRLDYILDRVLKDHYKNVDDIEEVRLSFFQKVKLLPTKNTDLQRLIEPILELNKIRNSYVHNLKFEPKGSSIVEIKKYVGRIENETPKPIEYIRFFCKGAEFCLLLETGLFDEKLKKYLPETDK